MSFQNDVKAFGETANDRAERAIRATAIGLGVAIINRTPVLTGRLRSNWRTTIGSIDAGSDQSTDSGKSLRILNNVVEKFSLGQTIFFTNSLPYAARIEYEGWSKVKAPQGMVRVSIAEFAKISKAAAQLVALKK